MDAIRVNENTKVSRVSSKAHNVCSDSNLTGFFIGDIMKEIPLTRCKFALVDDEDFEWLNRWSWYAWKNGSSYYYATRCQYLGGGRKNEKKKIILMHRLILNAEKGQITDHRNHNTLDNRKSNIRLCTHSQNMQNMKPHRKSTSKFKGVSWSASAKMWNANIYVGKQINLGYFENEIEAAEIYDESALKYFGEYAYCNFKE